MYKSTPHVGRAIKDYLATNDSDVDRADICVTTKLKGMPSGDYDGVREQLERHLGDLGLSYVDLLLVHWPGPADCGLESPSRLAEAASWEYFTEHMAEAW